MVLAFMYFNVFQKLFIVAWVNNVFQSWMIGRRNWFLMCDLLFKVGRMLNVDWEIDFLR